MNCRFCGTALPEDALFCGECGRAVAPAPVNRGRAAMPLVSSPVSRSRSEPEAVPRGIAVAESEFTCPQCSSAIDEDDVFCGECGFVLSSSYLSAPADAVGDPRETREIEPSPFAPTFTRAEPPAAQDAGEPEPEPEPEPVAVEPEPEPVAVEPEPELEPEPVAVEPEPEPEPVEPEPEPEPEPVAVEPEPAPPPVKKPLRQAPDPFPWGNNPRVPSVDLEATRIVAGPRAEERFVLQFSTGESVTVSGAGLVGRNPSSQPGEFVDQLVTIFDAGKSVSKTHLEFGQDSGRFWVSDRYSTNGSTVRQPDAEPKRCEPGRRYFVARGTRVDIGEQFFVVS